jgi:nitrate reductase NapA
MSSLDRRTFLRDVAAASAATAALATTPSALDAATVPRAPTDARSPVWKKAPCRLCGVGCGLLIGIENGHAGVVRGDPESPVGAGMACAKGYFSIQALYGRDRITRALVRRDGRLVPVPLGEALDLVARRLRETVEQHGKDSVGVYGSAQWTIPDAYVASKLFKGALGLNNVETSTRLHTASAMAGLESTFGLGGSPGSYEDLEHADVFVIWDANIAETDPVLFSRMLARKRANPAVRIIDVCTRTTRTSYAADRTMRHTPHTTLAIANAICKEIIARKLVDTDFVSRYVAFKRGRTGIGHGLSDLALVVDDGTDASLDEYAAFLAAYTPQHAEELSGLSAENIRWLATVYGDRSRKVMSVWSADSGAHGTWRDNALHNIHLLVGKVASPGNNAMCLAGQPSGGNQVHDAGTLAHTLPRGVVTNADDRRRAAAIWGVPEANIDPKPGRHALAMFQGLERDEIRFLWIQATNPMASLPNAGRYRKAAARAGNFIVVSEAYPTATTDIADVVLPAAMWIEREGVFANAERRLQHWERMVDPPGDAASDAWLMMEVARRLGHAALFPWEQRDHVAGIWDEYRRFHDAPDDALAPYAALRAAPGTIWPVVDDRETQWRYSTRTDPAAKGARDSFDFYGHPDHRAWIWFRPHEEPPESPDGAYPFWLGAGPVLEHWGTGAMTQRIPNLHRAAPHAYLELNSADAKRLGIGHGEKVRLSTRRGSLEIEARIDYRAQPPAGHVFVPGFDEALPVARLMLDSFCPVSGQPGAGWCAARVERLRAGAGA